jgi:hypothetical protein
MEISEELGLGGRYHVLHTFPTLHLTTDKLYIKSKSISDIPLSLFTHTHTHKKRKKTHR